MLISVSRTLLSSASDCLLLASQAAVMTQCLVHCYYLRKPFFPTYILTSAAASGRRDDGDDGVGGMKSGNIQRR